MKHLVLPCSVFLVLAGTAVLRAATPLPPWYLEPDTTREGYQFTSGSLNPLPEIDENPNGTPAAEVVVGEFSDGWQNPAVPWASHGLIGDGAWDLGVAGTFSVLSKIAADPPTPDSVFRVDFLIYVAYLYDSNIIVAPELDIGQTPMSPWAPYPTAPTGAGRGRATLRMSPPIRSNGWRPLPPSLQGPNPPRCSTPSRSSPK
jgi:hypothetical protein